MKLGHISRHAEQKEDIKMSNVKMVPCGLIKVAPQSTHRVVTAAFWRIFHHDGKIIPGWWGWWRIHALPLSLYLPSRERFWRTLQLRGQIHSPSFLSSRICTMCGVHSTFMVNSAQPGEGARPPPFTLSTITRKFLVYAPAERADPPPLFLIYPYM